MQAIKTRTDRQTIKTRTNMQAIKTRTNMQTIKTRNDMQAIKTRTDRQAIKTSLFDTNTKNACPRTGKHNTKVDAMKIKKWTAGIIALVLVIALTPVAPFTKAQALTTEGRLELITAGPSGTGGNSISLDPWISADGTKIVFNSAATDLIPGLTTNFNDNVFLYDVVTGTTTLVTAGASGVGGNGYSYSLGLSTDGTKILINSDADDLVFGITTNGESNVFLYDIPTATMRLVTAGPLGLGGDGYSYCPSIPTDGTNVVFNSFATDLVPGITTSGQLNTYLYDVATAETRLVSAGSSGFGGNSDSAATSATPDGSRILFVSYADDLISGITTTNQGNLFLYDVATGTTTLVTAGSSGLGGNGTCIDARITPDGSRVVFLADTTDLITGITTSSQNNIFLYDVDTATTTLVSAGNSGIGGNDTSAFGQLLISTDGTKVVFASRATNLIPGITTTSFINVFLYDVAINTTRLVTTGSSGLGGNDDSVSQFMTPDGSKIGINSSAKDLIPGITTITSSNAFLYDVATNTTTLLSAGPSGVGGDISSFGISISADGTRITLYSQATDLIEGVTINTIHNIYLYTSTTYAEVTFDPQNGEATTNERIVLGATVGKPADPVRAGYTFDGWYTLATLTGTLWDFDDPVEDDMTLFAHWTQIFTVTFDPQNAEATFSVEVPDGSVLNEPADPVRAGYTFDGWYTSTTSTGTLWDFDDPVEDDMTLFAHWTQIFTVTFDPQNGEATFTVEVPDGSLLDKPADPVRAGYTFDGWYTSATSTGVLWDFDDLVTGDMTLFAHWTQIFTVTFDPQNGEATFTVEVPDGSLLDEPTDPMRAGYTFDGWYTSATSTGVLWDFDDLVTGDMTLFAHWTKLHTVTFDPQNETPSFSIEVPDGQKLDKPADPARTDYVFEGWYTSATSTGVLWDFDDLVTGDMTLFAHWEPTPPVGPELPQTGDGVFVILPLLLLGTALGVALAVFGAGLALTLAKRRERKGALL